MYQSLNQWAPIAQGIWQLKGVLPRHLVCEVTAIFCFFSPLPSPPTLTSCDMRGLVRFSLVVLPSCLHSGSRSVGQKKKKEEKRKRMQKVDKPVRKVGNSVKNQGKQEYKLCVVCKKRKKKRNLCLSKGRNDGRENGGWQLPLAHSCKSHIWQCPHKEGTSLSFSKPLSLTSFPCSSFEFRLASFSCNILCH